MDTAANSSGNFGCTLSFLSRSIFSAWFSAYLLLLPFFLSVLYIGFSKWKKPPSSASGGLSHSDVFTLNTVVMEMIGIIGSCVGCYRFYSFTFRLIIVSERIIVSASTGQMLFHSLTCVERYLAVVHPVVYLRMKGEGGVTIRNISIAVVWVVSAVYCLTISLRDEHVLYGNLILTLAIVSMPAIIYCSIYVLCVLIRPKPGEKGGPQKQIDQSKRTTVYTMAAILGALLLRILLYLIYSTLYLWVRYTVINCIILISSLFIVLPSSLVLPLLFLHRAGKLLPAR